jgi:OmpA-OmpF porin, OOP family
MSVKKLLVLTAAAGVVSLGSAAALAGGPDIAPAFQQGVYVEGYVGYALNRYDMNRPGPFSLAGTTLSSNKSGGFTFGFDVGYQFTRHLALELGWFYLPRVKGNGVVLNANNALVNAGQVKVNSWFAYLAGKFNVPVPMVDNLDVFGKFGVAYRNLNYSAAAGTVFTNDTGYWTPMFAAGLQYMFTPAWSATFQWIHLPGYFKATPASRQAPNANLFLFGIGYFFAI